MKPKIIEVSQDEMVNVYEFGDLWATLLNISLIYKNKHYITLQEKGGRLHYFDRRYYQVEIVKYVILWEQKRYA